MKKKNWFTYTHKNGLEPNKKNLLLEGEDLGDAAVNRIMETRLSLVRDGSYGFTTVMNREIRNELREVAGTKDFVNGSKISGPFFVAKVWCKYTTFYTFPTQELASSTW